MDPRMLRMLPEMLQDPRMLAAMQNMFGKPPDDWEKGCLNDERRASNSREENKVIELTAETFDECSENDVRKAKELSALLSAAAAAGKPVNVNVRTKSGMTPLILAAFANGPRRMKVLLKHGADPNLATVARDETALHIAAIYGHYEPLKVLLEGGANPLLLDCCGRTPLDQARKPHRNPDLPGLDLDFFQEEEGPVDKSELVALLEQHMAKYESHLRTRQAAASKAGACSSSSGSSSGKTSKVAPAAAGGSSSSSSTKTKTAAAGLSAAGLDYSASTCDSCGQVPAEGNKLMKCSRCKLRAYCSKACQTADWPTHKAPCKMVADIKQRAAEVIDVSLNPQIRMLKANAFAGEPALQQISLDAKIIPQLVAALQTDQPIMGGNLPAMVAVLGLLRDLSGQHTKPAAGTFQPTLNGKALHPVAAQMFINAGGPVALLKAVSRRDITLCHAQIMSAFRSLSDMCATPQSCKSMVKKGMGTEIVQLLAPHVRSGHPLVVTNSGYCLAALLQMEQQQLVQQRKQQQQQSAASKQKKQQEQPQQQQTQQQELPPVLATVLQRVEVQKFVNSLGPNCTYNLGQFYQSRMEFWPALLASRVGYSAFKLQQPETFSQLLDNLVNAMCLASEEALAINLHTLYMVYCHSGLFVLQDEFGPVLLQYPEVFPGQEEIDRSGITPPQTVRDINSFKPGEALACQGLFISCLFDAAEHKTETYQCHSVAVNMWRESGQLLIAIWDAVPGVRKLYERFLGGVEDLIEDLKRSPQEQRMWHSLLLRIAVHDACRRKRIPFIEQEQWLPLLKQGEAEAMEALTQLGKRVAASIRSSGSLRKR